MATKPKAAPEPEPDPQAPVAGTMLVWVKDDRRDLAVGRKVELPRATACQWMVLSWFEPAQGVTFTRAELNAAGKWALEWHDRNRGGRGATPEGYWRIPINARFLTRLDFLTRGPEGPGGTAA